ncbi:hypothetical protein A5881_001974 [Enterococcus termitis]
MKKENFKIITKATGMKNLIYEDSSCYVYCNVADYRDEVLWVGIISIQDKKNMTNIQLKTIQKDELFRRINYLSTRELHKQVYTNDFGLVNLKPHSLEQPLLDWRCSDENNKN